MPDVVRCLADRNRVRASVAMVVAHPDDETIGAGASLHLFDRCLLVHVTDGAPRNLADARAAGFADAAAYGSQRRDELAAALRAGGARPRLAQMGVPDQGASLCLAALASQLAELLARNGVEAVLTHPYEGGHPDHDATAWAAHRAARLCPHPPAVIEFAGYHANPAGGIATGTFLSGGPEATIINLPPAERATKQRMLDCFVTQRTTLAAFGADQESFRPAPAYDFAQPPHPGKLYYENFDWGMTGLAWRALAAAA